VVDSVAALVPEYEEREGMEKQTIGLHARLMSKAMRKITGKASKNKTLVIFINQIREKVGAYGNPETTTGGRALGFYSSLRVEVRRGELLTEEKKIIGQQVKFKVTKSKVCPPYRDGYFIFYHPDPESPDVELFDRADELVSMLLLQGKIKRRGAYYDVDGQTFKGREELEREIRTNQKFRETLEAL
jgi:recombination protein RecA